MEIKLAGFNVDVEILKEVKNLLSKFSESLSEDEREKIKTITEFTPETISAAYARISRAPEVIWELRKIARNEVERARKSNEKIVFGLGHSSIAEHAVFNIDFVNISRLAVEFLEHFRLASFTEKSQRYVKFEDDFLLPTEFLGTIFEEDYYKLMRYLFSKYEGYYEEISRRYQDEGMKKKEADLKAKEDARYILPLSTFTQVGTTFNARTLERVIQKAKAHPLMEVREMGEKLERETSSITPSLIKYTKPEGFHLFTEKLLDEVVSDVFKDRDFATDKGIGDLVELIGYEEYADEKILALILFKRKGVSFEMALKLAKEMEERDKKRIFYTIFENLESYHSLLREFEGVDFEFILTVSASCFAQLKRHRMASLIQSPYNPNLGVVVPPIFKKFNLEGDFLKTVERINEFYEKISKGMGVASQYVLTNAHKKRVYIKMNLRELYHFMRLREDVHAQWEIRNIAKNIREIILKKSKYASLLLCGKDRFEDVKRDVLKKLKN